MADTSNLTNYLRDVANAIKMKKGITSPILAANFDIEIGTINTSGLDTSDATAVASDIIQGKTAYARGEKIVGTFSGSSDIDIGTTVTVEAIGAIAKGQRWEGILNDEFASETIGKQAVSNMPYGSVSEDLSVAIPTTTLTNTSAMFPVFFYDATANGYISSGVDVTNVVGELTTTTMSPKISHDGKLIVFAQKGYDKAVVIEVNKEAKTGIAYAVTLPHVVHHNCNSIYVASAEYGTFLLYAGATEKDGDAITCYQGARAVRYDFSTHSFFKSGASNENFNNSANAFPLSSTGKSGWADSNTLIALSDQYYFILKYNFGDTTTITRASASNGSISGDCTKYIDSSGGLSSFNSQDLSRTWIGNCFPKTGTSVLDITGRYAIKSDGEIYDVSRVNSTTKGTLIGKASGPTGTKMVNINKFTNIINIYGFPKGSTAQYLISQLPGDFDLAEDKYYGVTTNSMNLGDVGTAQLLFADEGSKYAPRCLTFMGYNGTELNYEITNLDTSNMSSMSFMFNSCMALTELNVSSFDTTNVTNMELMFANCSSLQSLDLSNFNTTNVSSMQMMFSDCTALTELNLSSFNTTNVGIMSSMFANCSSLKSLDLSSFNTESLIDMSSMFANCSSLQSLDLSNFNMLNVVGTENMFNNCTSLMTLDISSFDAPYSPEQMNTANMFLGVPDNCLIYVKDQRTKDWILADYSNLTNVQIKNI